jgi:hypothetical protein
LCAAHQAEQDAERMSGAYAFINDEKQNLSSFRDSLPNGNGARTKFDWLNPDISSFSIVLPGQLIVVGDDSTSMCTPEDNLLASYARDVRQSLIATDHASARVLTQNYDVLQSIMSYGSIGIGSVTSAWSAHLSQVESTLKDINDAYQRWRAGSLTKDQFVAQRQRLFNVLDGQLRGYWTLGHGAEEQLDDQEDAGHFQQALHALGGSRQLRQEREAHQQCGPYVEQRDGDRCRAGRQRGLDGDRRSVFCRA